jgi:hypothetical protein
MIKKSTAIAIAVASALLAPVSVFAQGTGSGGTTAGGAASGSAIDTPNAGSAGAGTTGVSGIPAGPGSAGGTNNSVNDPSISATLPRFHRRPHRREALGKLASS